MNSSSNFTKMGMANCTIKSHFHLLSPFLQTLGYKFWRLQKHTLLLGRRQGEHNCIMKQSGFFFGFGLDFVLFCFCFRLFRAAPEAHGSSQGKGQIAGLCHSNRIWVMPVTYAMAHSNTGSLTYWERPGIKPVSSWILVGFVTAEPQWELPWGKIFEELFRND